MSMASLGLSTLEAQQRLREVGPNEVRQRGRVSVWSSIGVQLRDPLIVVLLAACVLTLATGDLTDATVIAVVVLVNTTVGVFEEIRADRAITALAQLTAPSVRVRRDGVEVALPSAQLVPGDTIALGEGDIVPADCDLLEASSLLVDESALTGESTAVGKSTSHLERAGQTLSSGTVVVKGRALAAVTGTGAASALGQIAALLDGRVQVTPLQKRLAGLGRTLALTAVVLCGVVLVLGVARGQSLELMTITAISLAVAAVPESLPAVVTLSLALGARRMAARNAVVRRLPAVETLGSVTVLATDKTGTLTQAKMVVEGLWTGQHDVEVSGDGYSPVGRFAADGTRLDVAASPDVLDLLRACVLCNDAALVAPVHADAEWKGLGDPTEIALLSVGAKAGLLREELETEFPRVGEVPFESVAQHMTTVHDVGDGHLWVISKGSVEALYERHGRGAHEREWRDVLGRAAELASLGFRVLAVTAARGVSAADWQHAEHRVVGLVALNDPTKAAAHSTIAQCRRAGILPVLITGDHPATALAVAQRVGILDVREAERPDAVATGAQIAAGEVEDLTGVRVFARTSPEQKLDIVQAWKDRGDVVAMTGDGVNDGPALHRSDIGVAMGHRGTEVARQAADLVLADDELGTVVAAVEEGRRVYANIRLFLVFGLSGGAAEILVMLFGPLVGLGVPLLPAQILWINLLTHGVTGVALGAEPVAPGQMERPPRPPDESVLGDGLWQRVLGVAVILSTATLGLGVWADGSGREWQTIIFVALVSAQLGVALGLRPKQVTGENLLLLVAVAGSFLMAVAAVYVPVFQSFLGTVALPAGDLATAISVAVVGWVAVRLIRRRTPQPQQDRDAGRADHRTRGTGDGRQRDDGEHWWAHG
jgi:Ca2+-transporting ATPase